MAVAYGLCQRYHLESKVEDHSEGFFFYCVRCDLVKIVDGQEYTITSSYGLRQYKRGTERPPVPLRRSQQRH